MIEGAAHVLAGVAALFIEIAFWAIVCLYVALRAIVSPTHRKKIRREWDSGWTGKMSLVLSAAFWAAVVALALFIWFPADTPAA